MGLYQGSLSLTRYRLLHADASASLAKLSTFIEPFKARPLKLSGIEREEITGWVRPLGVDDLELGPDEHWDMSDCAVEDGFVLRLRVEKRKVPSQLMQLLFRERLSAYEAKRKKAPGRAERQKIKDDLKAELLGKTLPVLSFIDAFWREPHGEVLLFSTARRARTLFEELFRRSFAEHLGGALVRVEPPLLGLSSEEWTNGAAASAVLGRLSLTIPTSFSEHTY